MEKNITNNREIPLCVDLDGTLIQTDTLFESMLLSIKISPFILFFIPFWLLKGRAYLKKRIGLISIPNAKLLPYNTDVLDFIKEEKNKGRKIILASATYKPIAEKVANHLNIFDEVIATDGNKNLRSDNKRQLLVDKYGENGFDYIGDSKADLAVWKSANNAIIVNSKKSFQKKVGNSSKIFQTEKNKLTDIIKEIRVYQWVKNILIFLPFLMAHQVSFDKVTSSILAFLSFSFAASFVYLLNDLLDLEADRSHPRKKYRPIASGKMSIHLAIFLTPVLLIISFAIALLFLPMSYFYVLLIYLILTTSYSFKLKKIILLDVIILACLYTIRLIAGAYAVNVEVSPWLLGFSIFMFLSLAIMKRFTELKVVINENGNKTKGRGYHIDDIPFLGTLGLVSGFLSILVLSLYVNSQKVLELYHQPELLWLIILTVLYWLIRIWHFAYRGKMHDDPIVFTAKDMTSYIIGAVIIILVLGATL